MLEGSKVSPSAVAVFRRLFGAPPFVPAGLLVAFVLAMFALAKGNGRARCAVWGVGFASFLFQLVVLLSFQSFSGTLYRAIVLLTAVFMAGAAVGAIASIRHVEWGAGRLRLIHGACMGLTVVLPAWTIFLGHVHLSYPLGSLGFFACAACGGFLTGSYYPIVVRTAYPGPRQATPATFYAWDIFGACAAGLTGGIIFFPVVGVAGTVACIVLIHAFAAALLAGKW
jgi:hypothetical protein